MEHLLLFVVICLVAGAVNLFINYILAPRLECDMLHPLLVFLRSLVLICGLLIYEPWARSHIPLSFSMAVVFDYFYYRLLIRN